MGSVVMLYAVNACRFSHRERLPALDRHELENNLPEPGVGHSR